MGLQGRLMYISSSFGSENGSVSILFHVEVLDLASGSLTSVFHAPAGDLVEFLSASPDGKQIVMQYLPALETMLVPDQNRNCYTACLWMAPSLRVCFFLPLPPRISIINPPGRRMVSISTFLTSI